MSYIAGVRCAKRLLHNVEQLLGVEWLGEHIDVAKCLKSMDVQLF
jgi:hypothetical protein